MAEVADADRIVFRSQSELNMEALLACEAHRDALQRSADAWEAAAVQQAEVRQRLVIALHHDLSLFKGSIRYLRQHPLLHEAMLSRVHKLEALLKEVRE